MIKTIILKLYSVSIAQFNRGFIWGDFKSIEIKPCKKVNAKLFRLISLKAKMINQPP